eukprot:CAMPEP_0201866848 /NCGR_PEP_ID=MMETSP0902-20130614/1290_1 /ASSEMBLY_ACC=CAM_ASM_000551 /TAXON_ID=420261 /ORGANISM="Thalassiosira antarctica, Strain CCMP982" /LENGTH=128 /DNA_ID=CAMNT_0048391893 /DNA_START=142 /DNA_END=528 /DNA_ORIENTATION=-
MIIFLSSSPIDIISRHESVPLGVWHWQSGGEEYPSITKETNNSLSTYNSSSFEPDNERAERGVIPRSEIARRETEGTTTSRGGGGPQTAAGGTVRTTNKEGGGKAEAGASSAGTTSHFAHHVIDNHEK